MAGRRLMLLFLLERVTRYGGWFVWVLMILPLGMLDHATIGAYDWCVLFGFGTRVILSCLNMLFCLASRNSKPSEIGIRNLCS